MHWKKLPTVERCGCKDVDHLYVCGGSTETTAAKSPTQQSPQAAPNKSSPRASELPKSASCSDITGTSDTSSAPTSQDCKDANRALHAARVTREKYPLVSADEYKKAAEAARRAGDTQLELNILREAATAPPSAPLEEPCAASMREAASYLTGAEAIKERDRSCHGLTKRPKIISPRARFLFVRSSPANQRKR